MDDKAAAERIVGLYDDKAEGWIADRRRTLGQGGRGVGEAGWLDRFAAAVPPGGAVLDVGCGSGWPIAAALLGQGFRVTGVDSSPRLIAHARETLPAGDWRVGDMRDLDLDQRFDGLLAWHSLFHLTADDQRRALPRILAHGAERAAVMFSSGPGAGVAMGEWRGEPLHHASLDPGEYAGILADAGYVPDAFDTAEFDGAGRIWLARRV